MNKWRDASASYLFTHLVTCNYLATAVLLGLVYHHDRVLGNYVPWWVYAITGWQVLTAVWITILLWIAFKQWVYRQWRLR